MRSVLAVLALSLLTGCATVNETVDGNAQCGPHPYCGTATDVKYLGALTDGKAGVLAWFIPLVIIDLPLSLVADTVVLPYTASNGWGRR